MSIICGLLVFGLVIFLLPYIITGVVLVLGLVFGILALIGKVVSNLFSSKKQA